MDKNSADYGLQMLYDSFELSDEEFAEKYPKTDEFTDPLHGKRVGMWEGDAYHHPCPVYEDGWRDYAWG